MSSESESEPESKIPSTDLSSTAEAPDATSSKSPENSTPAPTAAPAKTPREVVVNFAEPDWHKERLEHLSEEGKRLSQAHKKTRSSILALAILGLLTVASYLRDWHSSVQIIFVILDVFAALSLLGNFTTEREVADALRNAESLAKLSAALFTQKPAAEHNYFESLVTINVENLREYYLLVKQHTSHSYRVSLAAGILGFLLICGALVASYVQGELNAITYIGTGAGLIVEFIAGIFFYLYNKTVRQLKGYHDSLLDVQNILLALKLIESASKDDARAPMLQSMIAFLMSRRGLLPDVGASSLPADQSHRQRADGS